MTRNNNGLRFLESSNIQPRHAPRLRQQVWNGTLTSIAFDEAGIKAKLLNLDQPCYVVRYEGQIGVTNEGYLDLAGDGGATQVETLIAVPPLRPRQLGDPNFLTTHGVKYAYATGAMANGIAGEDLVIAMGRQKLLSSFGAAGLSSPRIEAAIHSIQQALPMGPYAFNLIHSPSEEALERNAVELYLKYGVSTVEASAFLDLTPHVVRYRAAGLTLNAQNQIESKNRIIAKLSRREVATKFMAPAPDRILHQLVQQGLITERQATLAEKVPVAHDITVEADSGGHTDNRPLVSLLPSMLALRDEIQEKYRYPNPIRVGAAGGISTPTSALAAFIMGAAYVVSGSVNQSCLEAAASQHTKKLLAEADMADVIMAPAADMFEMGVKVQVLKRGTLFPMRAQKLFDLYKAYNSIEEIPLEEREKLEKQIFKRSVEAVWNETVAFFSARDPDQITRAADNPRRKMALIFRWYLGLSSRWSNSGEKGREIDFQIWCGPSMGAFNDWVRGSYLAEPDNRSVVDVASHIMTGAAFLYRLHHLKIHGLEVPAQFSRYRPTPLGQAVSSPNLTQQVEDPRREGRRSDEAAMSSFTNSRRQAQVDSFANPPSPIKDAQRGSEGRSSDRIVKKSKRVEIIQDWLVSHLAERLEVKRDDIDIREPFDNYDLDSAQVLVLASKLEEQFGCQLSPTLLWNYPTIEALAQRLAEEAEFSEPVVQVGTDKGA